MKLLRVDEHELKLSVEITRWFQDNSLLMMMTNMTQHLLPKIEINYIGFFWVTFTKLLMKRSVDINLRNK